MDSKESPNKNTTENVYRLIASSFKKEIKKTWNNTYGKIYIIGMGLAVTSVAADIINYSTMPSNEIYAEVQQIKKELNSPKTMTILPETTIDETMKKVEQIYETRQEQKNILTELVNLEEYETVLKQRETRNKMDPYFTGMLVVGLVAGTMGLVGEQKKPSKKEKDEQYKKE